MVLQYLTLFEKKRILLASGSPRRLEILGRLGLPNVEVCVSSFAEDLPKADFTCGGDYALRTARQKAECVVHQLQQNERSSGATPSFDILIAADTVVTLPAMGGGVNIIEKPLCSEEAAQMLRSFSGTKHYVWSGVVLAVRDGETLRWREFTARTVVEFAPLAEAEIAAYVSDSSNWIGKAGGYGIQDRAACLVTSIEGDYYNVMGLPLQALCKEIDQLIQEGILK
ncbi:putative septum formation inhibitor, Maf-like protein [Trypanosoma theileri]|uniref:Putative septum formation inhibitor, Maf-like protein n=1 Tax=Trypanosoma theileri TaxID=67003 RepID=A0A1X0NW46_9TRYP|nr:putative septum formation inhibitor, Maf-like protein [Trypanosoma theileri]ORC88924.1 putative septum formation inhibitor, Maf-like protein [Trypanosoma theileri]